jgi:hypothetical protein
MINKQDLDLLSPIITEMVNSEEITRFPLRRESNGDIAIGIKPLWEDDLKVMDKFFNEGKDIRVWQIALMSMQGMTQRGVKTDWSRIEELAGGVAASFYPDGKLHVKVTYQDGKVVGFREEYDDKGNLTDKRPCTE